MPGVLSEANIINKSASETNLNVHQANNINNVNLQYFNAAPMAPIHLPPGLSPEQLPVGQTSGLNFDQF